MAGVWPGVAVEDNTIQVHISAVRKALGPDPRLAATTTGRGDRLLGTWTAESDATPHRLAVPLRGRRPRHETRGNLPVSVLGASHRSRCRAEARLKCTFSPPTVR